MTPTLKPSKSNTYKRKQSLLSLSRRNDNEERYPSEVKRREARLAQEKLLEIKSPCKKDPNGMYVGKGVRVGEKVVVTWTDIDDWRAQLYGLRIDNFPNHRPAKMDPALFDELKKKYGSLTSKKKNKNVVDTVDD